MSEAIASSRNTILAGDCVAGMQSLRPGSVNLIFADPPFNIGYEYDVYKDALAGDQYVAWSKDWMQAAYDCLNPEGTFWLAIGDEYAAELKVTAREIGFHMRSWVIWYYTFGVNCQRKFSRSHAHLFYFVKNANYFTFLDDEPANRIPSARQLVYNDKRANPAGRLPDDTWIISPDTADGELQLPDSIVHELREGMPGEQTWTLRPQDLESCFQAEEDTWYFPRVAGTFKERAGFHGCQMPEQLLGRIIRSCSRPGELVLDPFSGSATTLAVAKKLNRNYLGFELSEDYVAHGLARLDGVRVGDRLEGAAEPLMSAPKTKGGKKAHAAEQKATPSWDDEAAQEARQMEKQLELTLVGIAEAFRRAHDGFSVDRLLADPDLNLAFADECRKLGLVGDPQTWNLLLLRLRKQKDGLQTGREILRTGVSWAECDRYLAASEMALQSLLNEDACGSLDDLLCDPVQAAEFDRRAASIAPGFTPFEYRWAALKLRKEAKVARGRGFVLYNAHRQQLNRQFGAEIPLTELSENSLPNTAGVYLLSGKKKVYYAGETRNLQMRLRPEAATSEDNSLLPDDVTVRFAERPLTEQGPLAWQSCLVMRFEPRLNFHELNRQNTTSRRKPSRPKKST